MKINRLKDIFILTAVIFLSAGLHCSGAHSEETTVEFEKTISPGMSKQDILIRLGHPRVKRQFADGSEVWIYMFKPDQEKSGMTYSVIFNPGGKVVQVVLPQEEGSQEINVLVR